jgi:hypothetical protein
VLSKCQSAVVPTGPARKVIALLVLAHTFSTLCFLSSQLHPRFEMRLPNTPVIQLSALDIKSATFRAGRLLGASTLGSSSFSHAWSNALSCISVDRGSHLQVFASKQKQTVHIPDASMVLHRSFHFHYRRLSVDFFLSPQTCKGAQQLRHGTSFFAPSSRFLLVSHSFGTCQCVLCYCFSMNISYRKVTQPHCG